MKSGCVDPQKSGPSFEAFADTNPKKGLTLSSIFSFFVRSPRHLPPAASPVFNCSTLPPAAPREAKSRADLRERSGSRQIFRCTKDAMMMEAR